MHEQLARQSPSAAAGILPGNGRRIVRALEVIEMTGSFTSRLPEPEYALEPVRQFGLGVPNDVLDRRIAARVDIMWQAGFVEEVESLVQRGLRRGVTASRALGYRQVLAYLDGECSLKQAREATIVATRQFARKQAGWFRRDHRIMWLPYDAPMLARRMSL